MPIFSVLAANMLTPAHHKELKRIFKRIYLGYIASFFPVLLCVIICWMAAPKLRLLMAHGEYPLKPSMENSSIQWLIFVIAMMLGMVIGMLRNGLVTIVPKRWPWTGTMPSPPPIPRMAGATYKIGCSISCILTDTIMFTGLVLFFISGNVDILYLYFAMWTVMLIMLRPRYKELVHIAQIYRSRF